MLTLEAAYLLWVFLSALGAAQFAAVHGGLWGIVILRSRPRAAQGSALFLVAASFAWFFASGDRNQPDVGEGLNGVEQARWFAVSAAASVVFQLAVSSALNHRWGAAHNWDPDIERWPPPGLAWMERTTFASALAALARAAVRRGR